MIARGKISEAYADLGPPSRFSNRRPGSKTAVVSRAAGPLLPIEPAGWRAWLADEYPACRYGAGSDYAEIPWPKVPDHIRKFVIEKFEDKKTIRLSE